MTHIGFPCEAVDSSRRAGGVLPGALLALCLAVLIAACAPIRSDRIDEAAPDLSIDSLQDLAQAVGAQCALTRPPGDWPRLCARWPNDPASQREWIARHFEAVPLRNGDGSDRGLITGYYEPELSGSLRRESARQAPLLRRPPPGSALARAPRAVIEAQEPAPVDVVAWIDDPVDAYFLQVQGSGRVRLRDGRVIRVGYAGDNGHPYRAIGRDLIERGEIDAASMSAQAIIRWLRERPEAGGSLMASNPRYVFFREMPPPPGGQSTGPIGSLGVALTPLRSIAVDPRAVPLGSLLWLEVDDPRGGGIRRLVLAQDTGSAIVGSPRADLFWGTGAAAGDAAGQMKSTGRLWLMRERR